MRVLLLHPGAMGAAMGRALRAGGHEVVWSASGRSDATVERAHASGLTSAPDLASGLDGAELVASIIPPHAAEAVARDVARLGFAGTYCDANAIAPATAASVAGIVRAEGAAYVDGSIVGPPPTEAGQTRLYLSGGAARDVAALFEGGIVEARVLEGGAWSASALKMAYAAYTKIGAALLLTIAELARAEGVDRALLEEWAASIPELPARLERIEGRIDEKAWRYVGEMLEIAKACEAHGLPGGFGRAASEAFRAVGPPRA